MSFDFGEKDCILSGKGLEFGISESDVADLEDEE